MWPNLAVIEALKFRDEWPNRRQWRILPPLSNGPESEKHSTGRCFYKIMSFCNLRAYCSFFSNLRAYRDTIVEPIRGN